MEKNPAEFFALPVLEDLKKAIESNQGGEVFFIGFVNPETRKITEVEAVVFGNQSMTPVFLEKAVSADVVIHNHPSGNLQPSHEDLQMADILMNHAGVSFLIVDNVLSRVRVVYYAPLLQEKEKTPLKEEEILSLFRPGGKIAEGLPGFELRASQEVMVQKIVQAFNQNLAALIEAGTGTGKSLAYLVPGIFWALQNKEKVVISTYTKNLQHQLAEKDLPLLSKILGQNFSYALVKGRSNYLCKKKLDEALASLRLQQEEGLLFGEEEEKKLILLQGIETWSRESRDGDLEDLTRSILQAAGEEIRAASDLCMHRKCPFFDSCFVNQARQRVFSSQIIITNHHYLLGQLSLEYQEIPSRILPPFTRVVVDEAHNFKKAALSYLQESVSFLGLMKTLNRLYSFSKKGRWGELNQLSAHLKKVSHAAAKKIIHEIEEELRPFLFRWREQLAGFFRDLYQEVSENLLGQKKETSFRLKESTLPFFESFREGYSDLCHELKFFEARMEQLEKLFKTLPEDFRRGHELLFKGLERNAALVVSGLNFFQTLFAAPAEETALWLQVDRYYENISLNQAHLDTTDFFQSVLHKPEYSLIFTSATLSVGGKFQQIKEDLSLPGSPAPLEAVLPAPFNYSRQCRVLVPLDIPAPKGSDFQDSPFIQKSLALIHELITLSQGGAFVLCTSFYQVKLVKDYLFKKGCSYPLVVHGENSKNLMVDQFKSQANAVLLGADSFWEGVDIQGNALRLVIIFKLPFRPPTDPATETLYEILEKRGENPFMKIAVPEAVIRFKQGFGRLIRSASDRGLIAVLDNRIMEQRYGKIFIDSLPIKREEIVYRQSSLLFQEADRFLNFVSHETK